MPTIYQPRVKVYSNKYLKRKDGLVVPYNDVLAKEPGFELYEPEPEVPVTVKRKKVK